MLNSLFNKKLSKKIDSLAKQEAKLKQKQYDVCEEIMHSTSKETIYNVFDIVEKFGHPKEQAIAQELKNKYESMEDFSIDELITLETLYKSNYTHMKNKGDCNE